MASPSLILQTIGGELFQHKSFREIIGALIVGADLGNSCCAIVDVLPKEVEFAIQPLGSFSQTLVVR